MSGGVAEGAGSEPAADAPPRPPRKTYVTHPPAIWARARERYAEGATAGEVAGELGVSISAVRLQASRGGWTRRALAEREAGEGGGEAKAPGAAGRFTPPLAADDPERQAGPTWIRLSDGAWEAMQGEYEAGATARTIAKKWGVGPGTVYRRASEEGWTKKARGAVVSEVMLARETSARARKAEAEACAAEEAAVQAASAPAEGDPLVVAGLMLRQAAGAAAMGDAERARGLVALSQALRAAHDAYVGPYQLGLARKSAAEAMALAARFAWYEELRETFAAEGEAMPSPTMAGWLAATGGPPEEVETSSYADGRQPSSDDSAPGCAGEGH